MAVTSVPSITCGASHTCATRTTGKALCWGHNFHAQLGDGTTADRNKAAYVKSSGINHLTGVSTVVAGGYHACALMLDARMMCWGNNGYGQLGDGSNFGYLNPVYVLVKPGGVPLVVVYFIRVQSQTMTRRCVGVIAVPDKLVIA